MARKNDEIVVQVDRVEQQTRPGPHVHPSLAVSLPQDQITADLHERVHTATGRYCSAGIRIHSGDAGEPARDFGGPAD